MKLGNIVLEQAAVLAPMAGVADRAFRELCIEYGAAYVVAEMASAKGLTLSSRKTAELLELGEKERPGAVQLFGDDPKTMAEAAKIAQEFHPDAIDLNMGCPAPKIVGSSGGSALMKTPTLAGEIVAAVVDAVEIPVTVKIRKGWDDNIITAVEIAKLAEQAGAAAITVHGRTRAQMYAPPVDLDIIRSVKNAVNIPVIGNGDIVTPQDAKAMLETTGCDMVMIGRGALGSPWLFAQVRDYLSTGRFDPDPPLEERMRVMVEHVERICRYKGEYVGMREARKHAAWYIKGLHGAAQLRRLAGELKEVGDIHRLAERVLEHYRQ